MSLMRRSGARFSANIWPGFVDAMTALLLVLMFVLSIFMIVQSILRDQISGQQTELNNLEVELIQLIDKLDEERSSYKKLDNQYKNVNSELKIEKLRSEEKEKKLILLTSSLTQSNIKIADFEVRVASLIARRTALNTKLKEAQEEIDSQLSRVEAARLSLAYARNEIDEKQELARLAAARAEALEALVLDFREQKVVTNKKLENTLSSLDIKTVALLAMETKFLKAEERLGVMTTALQSERNFINNLQIGMENLQELLNQSQQELTEEESNRLVDKLAIQRLRERLQYLNEEVDVMSLSLEEERKQAFETLELLASSRAALKTLEERNSELKKKNITKFDLLKARELALNELRKQLMSKAESEKYSRNRVQILNDETLSLAKQVKELRLLLGEAVDRDKKNKVQINMIGNRLNSALAEVLIEQKKNFELQALDKKRLEAETENLKNYRSEFFGRLKEILGKRKGIEIVGDRFVFSSEILFDTGADIIELGAKKELRQVSKVIRQLIEEIPSQIDWILRVDGHTDNTPFLGGEKFKDNWQLSQSRALSVVKFFISEEGLPARRFAAAGFAEFQPIDPAQTESALAKNRRIEIKLTER